MGKLKNYLPAMAGLVILAGVLTQSCETLAKGPPQFNPAAPCGVSPVWQRFVVSQDGTEVCDNTTGLVWQREPTDQDPLTNEDPSWHRAMELCQALGDGYRLPEIEELFSLVDYGEVRPALPPNHPFVIVRQPFLLAFWTATASPVGNGNEIWYILIDDGSVNRDFSLGGNAVWCVRNGH